MQQFFQNIINACSSVFATRNEADFEINTQPEWIDRGNGHWEFTGTELRFMPYNIAQLAKVLLLPNAKKVSVSDCNNLTTIDAPNVEVMVVQNCHHLTTVNVPNAEYVYIKKCHNVKTVDAQNAKDVCVKDCDSLTTIDVRNAKSVAVEDCHKVKTVDAQNAKSVEVVNCRNVKTVDAQNAEKVSVKNCYSLTTIDVRNAKAVCVKYCDSLTTIDARNADRVEVAVLNAYNCKTIINAPNARTYIIRDDIDNLDGSDVVNKTINQIAKPQNLESFRINREDVAKDIKNADNDLNKTEIVTNARKAVKNEYAKLMQDAIMKANGCKNLPNGVIGEIVNYLSLEDAVENLTMSQLSDNAKSQIKDADNFRKSEIARRVKDMRNVQNR